MKFQAILKFSDVITEIEAESLGEAQNIANSMDTTKFKEDTYCYGKLLLLIN